jgi:hypothetical protein
MPALPTLRIEQSDGTERATLTGIRTERDRHVTDRSRARFEVDRETWQTVASAINERDDRFRIDADGVTGWFGGRFRDTERGGNTVTVILDDYERDAVDAAPTGGQVVFQNVDDSAVVTDALSRVPTLSAGTVATGLSFSFANAEPAKMIRDAAEPGGALVRYNADRTVDFVERPAVTGSEPELSTAAETLVGDPALNDDNRNPPTIIIGLGAQSGPNQVRATSVVTPGAAREVYRRYENKDIQNEARLQTIVDRLATEVSNAPVKLDLEAEAVGLDVRPGDPIDVVWPAENIDTTLRVIEFTEVVEATGRRYTALRVANRWPEQGGAQKALNDLERFNRGYQGFVDRDNFSFDNQPVTSTLNAEDSYFYPDDVISEVRAEIRVRGRAYRAYSSGAADNSDINNIGDDAVGGGQVQIDTTPKTILSFTVPSSPNVSNLFTGVNLNDDDGDAVSGTIYLRNTTTGDRYPENNNIVINPNNAEHAWQFVHRDVSGESFEWVYEPFASGGDILVSGWWQTAGKHTHAPDPGVTEFNQFPSNCDVLVNGTSAGVSLGTGSGEFAETVDISGLLTAGDNEIEITSDSTGRVTGAIRTELFRQGPEQTL